MQMQVSKILDASGLKGEGATPHEQEIGLEERGIELIGNAGSASGSSARRPIVRMWFSLRPNAGAVCLWPSITRWDLDDVFIVSCHWKISCVTVLLLSRV